MKFIKNIWNIICYPLMYFGVQLVIFFIYEFVYMFIYIFNSGLELGIENIISDGTLRLDNIDIEEIILNMNFIIPFIICTVVTILIIFLILRKQWKAERFWSFSNIKITPAILCLFFGAAANILTICFLNIIQVSQEPSILDNIFGDNLLLDILVIAILAPVLEEIIFRGIVLNRLSKMTRRHIAVFLQALIFGFIHFDIVQGIYAFFLGIFIGYIYIWFDSVWYAIAVHSAYNATNIVLMYMFKDTDIDLFYFLIISAAVFIISMASMVALADKREKEKEREDLRNNL